MIGKKLNNIKNRLGSLVTDIFDKNNEKGEKIRCRAVIAACGAVCIVLAATVVCHTGVSVSKQLYFEGSKIGFIDSENVYKNAREDAEKVLTEKYGIAYKFPDESANFRLCLEFGTNRYLTKTELTDFLICEGDKNFTDGFGLYLDGDLITVGKSREDVQSILDGVISLYSELYSKVKSSNDIIIFNSKTKIEPVTVPSSMVKSLDEMKTVIGLDSLSNLNEVLLKDKTAEDELTVKDILETIPEYESINQNDISLSLPAENVYYLGSADVTGKDKSDELVHNNVSMSFGSSCVEVSTEILECGEEIIYDDTLEKGKKILKSSGVYGVKEVTYEVYYLNGEELTRTMLSENIIKEAVPKVYRVGTKKKSSESSFTQVYTKPSGDTPAGATGSFIMPTKGIMTSGFEGRKVMGRSEFHGALDIANKTGTPVYAADGGTVILAEWFDSYGNCIIIDHGNGFKTLYAHLSSYSVKNGDVVGQGWKIGEIGMTGRVTGAHLHFEVRVNDVKVNPLNYLP